MPKHNGFVYHIGCIIKGIGMRPEMGQTWMCSTRNVEHHEAVAAALASAPELSSVGLEQGTPGGTAESFEMLELGLWKNNASVARRVLGSWSKRCKLAHAFLWE